MKEPLPLARVHEAVLEFLRHRKDAALFGPQAVNAYSDEPRMTQDVDVLSPRAPELAEQIRKHLSDEFHIAARVRQAASGQGFRIFQLRMPKNRHLVDVRQVPELPPTHVVADILVTAPEELIAQKVISATVRRAQPKGDTDHRDLKVLLLTFPHLKAEAGPVMERLRTLAADPDAIEEWKKLVASKIEPPEPEDDEW